MDEGREGEQMLSRSGVRVFSVAVVLVVLAACSVSSTDGSEAGSAATSDGDQRADAEEGRGRDEPLPGLTEDTIKLGLALIDQRRTFETFGVDIGEPPPDELIPAIVDTINDDGGINGRSIELVQRTFLPQGDDESEQVCRELTEDEGVAAVIGTFLNDSPLCVAEVHETPYIGGWGLTDETRERVVAPIVVLEAPPEEQVRIAVDRFLDEGALDDRRLAVYYEGNQLTSTVEDDVLPTLEDAGVDVVSSAMLPETDGDQVQGNNDIDRIFQRFEADGADTLLAFGGGTYIVPALGRTSWTPQIVLAGSQFAGESAMNTYGLTDPSIMEGARLAAAVTLGSETVDDPVLNDCLDGINERTDLDVTPEQAVNLGGEPGEFPIISMMCGLFEFARLVLEAAGDQPTNESIIEGLDTLDSISASGYDSLSLSSERWYAIDETRLWTFDVDQNMFVPDEPLD